MRAFLMTCALLALAGCSSAPTKDSYSEYLQVVSKRQEAQEARVTALASMATACQDARCVESIGAMAAIAMLGSQMGGGGGMQIQAPQREPSGMEKFVMFMNATTPMAGMVMNGLVNMRQSDNAVKQSEAQFNFLSNAINGTTSSMASVANGATAGMAQVAGNAIPSITVTGGQYISGNGNATAGGQLGDSAGHDLVTGQQVLGSIVGRDQVGRDNVLNSHVGDNDRNGSPGPFEGAVCTGDGCQPSTTDDQP